MHTNLVAHIKNYVALNDAEVQVLHNLVKPIQLKKKTYLLKEGQVCKANYFVSKGCLRMFFINDKGIEQITQFALENWWLADYGSFGNQTASTFYIQAIENSEVLAVDFQTQEQLFKQVPQIERYFRILLQRAYAATQLRIKYQYSFSKEEQYHHFSSSFPQFVQRIPQYMLASYLDFTPEYLSELRKKKS